MQPENKVTITDVAPDRREVYELFDLPVNNLTIKETKEICQAERSEKAPLVLSTINVNWVVMTFQTPSFYQSVLKSDLIVLDGKPLLWLGKFKKYPFVETVPGSTLVDELKKDKKDTPVKVFLFGGDDGVGAIAMDKVNGDHTSGIKIVGEINPGFGSIEEMSHEEYIAQINETEPDLLLVALGAKKGMEWITFNKEKLHQVKVVSHLGATINFLAGSVIRAPRWMQVCGLEWIWRILQEPKLFWRYLKDGLFLIKILLFKVKRDTK